MKLFKLLIFAAMGIVSFKSIASDAGKSDFRQSISLLGSTHKETSQASDEVRQKREKYFQLIALIEPDWDGIKWVLSKRKNQLEQIYKTLEIEVSISDMEQSVKQYGVLMHRRPSHQKLVIGCGNLPVDSGTDEGVYCVDPYDDEVPTYRSLHRHEDADSIDPDFAKNATFVGEFGVSAMHELFGNHKYKEIFIEGIYVFSWDLATLKGDLRESRYSVASLVALLEEDGVVNQDNECFYTKAELKEYLDTGKPPHHHFDKECITQEKQAVHSAYCQNDACWQKFPAEENKKLCTRCAEENKRKANQNSIVGCR